MSAPLKSHSFSSFVGAVGDWGRKRAGRVRLDPVQQRSPRRVVPT
ncbi:MAG: hypothetical protein ABIO70_19325 [Pseudomonadota bacterium]